MQEGRKYKGKDERGWEIQRKICKRMGNIMIKMQVVGKKKILVLQAYKNMWRNFESKNHLGVL